MKKIKKLALFSLMILHATMLCGQGANISVESMPGFPAEALFNQSYTFSAFLSNNDSTSYQDSISLHYYSDSFNGMIGTFGGPYSINIQANSFDTIDIGPFTFDTGTFKMGGNVVVVWPVASSGAAINVTDTFYTYIEITGYAGIEDFWQNESGELLYPVPADQLIFLPKNKTENSVEYVRIIDMLGRERYFSDKVVTSINTSFLENGVYFVEIKENNKLRKVLKFMVNR